MERMNGESTTLTNIINLLSLEKDLMEDNEKDYILMQEDLYKDIENTLKAKGLEEVDSIMNDIHDYGDSCKREMFHVGIKMGMKLMKEINIL